jgi:hypothetical protein
MILGGSFSVAAATRTDSWGAGAAAFAAVLGRPRSPAGEAALKRASSTGPAPTSEGVALSARAARLGKAPPGAAPPPTPPPPLPPCIAHSRLRAGSLPRRANSAPRAGGGPNALPDLGFGGTPLKASACLVPAWGDAAGAAGTLAPGAGPCLAASSAGCASAIWTGSFLAACGVTVAGTSACRATRSWGAFAIICAAPVPRCWLSILPVTPNAMAATARAAATAAVRQRRVGEGRAWRRLPACVSATACRMPAVTPSGSGSAGALRTACITTRRSLTSCAHRSQLARWRSSRARRRPLGIPSAYSGSHSRSRSQSLHSTLLISAPAARRRAAGLRSRRAFARPPFRLV